MNILLVTPMPPAPRANGAIPVLLHAQLTGLRATHDVTLVTVAGPREEELEAVSALVSSGLAVHAARRTEPSGSQIWRRRAQLAHRWLGSRSPRRTVWFYEPEVQVMIDRLSEDRSFDVVAVEDNAMGVYRFPAQIPSILTEHEVRRPRPVDWRTLAARGAASTMAELDWHRWRRYQVAVWSKFALVQVFTERDAEAMAALAPALTERIRVNPYGIEVPQQADAEREEPGRVLFVGNFRHAPNVDAGLWLCREILPRLRSRFPEARATLVGINAPREIRGLAGQGVEVFAGVDDLGPLLSRAAVVLAPIRIGGGMRMKVLHAMAAGKAVVTTARGAEGLSVAGEETPLVVAEGASGIAAAAGMLLADPSQRHELGARARRFVEAHFGVEAYTRRLESVYGELATHHTADAVLTR